MIIADSRFRVANGMERDVRQAFIDRPHLVDRVPGFLGMEVFTDASDASIFHLVTRWTDVGSFRAWHASENHRLSHCGIPRGLKLDPAETRVLVLDRIEDPRRPATLEDATADMASFLAAHLAESATTSLVMAAPDGTVRLAGAALEHRSGVGPGGLCGQSLWAFVAPDNLAALQERIATEGRRRTWERFLLNLLDSTGNPYTLECRLDVQPDGFVLIGEPARQDPSSLNVELIRSNNDLAVLSRETERQRRAVEEARAELERTVEDLRRSYWHLRKIQEVLPICMRCSRVKTGEARWDDVVQYLKQNALFLSHGYCPSCAVAVREELRLADPDV